MCMQIILDVENLTVCGNISTDSKPLTEEHVAACVNMYTELIANKYIDSVDDDRVCELEPADFVG